ncbi:MAG: 2-amino-3,7-dideoxy-D-threo-hept-6-ulosonate synthase [Spirochaetes bacterium]|nr:2-amino-3,7-dideoxy-D-threo-hept-6-ulosonate synthase [Spirochaetota bacterium]
MIGKLIRLERIINRESGRSIIIPLDHGLTMGPIPGIENIRQTVAQVAIGGVNAVLMHKGNIIAGHRGQGRDLGLIIHLSGQTQLSPTANDKVLVCTVEEAIKLGADGISMHVNLGAENDGQMLKDFGLISRRCEEWGIPLLAMMYTRGPKIQDPFAIENVKLAARVANELGADMVKVNFTGDAESFAKVVEGCAIPVLIAGGEKAESTSEILTNIKMAMDAGAKGISIGRNVFQHDDPARFCEGVAAMIHHNATLEEAISLINGVV